MIRFLVAAAAALALSAGPAHAQHRGGRGDDTSLSVYAIGSYYWWAAGVGVGARFQFPLIPQGILQGAQVREDIAMDLGADFIHVGYGEARNYDPVTDSYYWSSLSYNAVIPAVGLLWNFHITPELTVYPKVEAGVAFGTWSDRTYWGTPHAGTFFFAQASGGAKLDLGNLAVMGELGTGMLKLGISIPL